jgi:hypothetical protein
MGIIFTPSKPRKKLQNTRKRQELRRDWQELLQKWPVSSAKPPAKALPDTLGTVLKRHASRLVSTMPSIQTAPEKPQLRKVYVGEMAEREAKAQSEIRQNQKRVAVLYNKGTYGYITEGMDPKTFGRK